MEPAVWWGILTTVGMALFGALVFANVALAQIIRLKARWRALTGKSAPKGATRGRVDRDRA